MTDDTDDRCPTCAGTGKEDDCHPLDFWFNEWPCRACGGTGKRATVSQPGGRSGG